MSDTLEWKYLKGMYQLYTDSKTRIKLDQDKFIETVLIKQKGLINHKMGNRNIYVCSATFKSYFEKNYLEQYEYYAAFFEKSGIDNSAHKKYTKYDLEALIFIYHFKEDLRKDLTTIRKFAQFVFDDESEKYLENKTGLLNDVLRVLEIEQFPDEDPKNHQWRLVGDCLEPKAIVLCENKDCLKSQWRYTRENLELWYVGGNNTKILNEISDRYLDLPLYYFCDWDYDGLKIFQRIVEIFKMRNKPILLLEPKTYKTHPVKSKHHKSSWNDKPFSGLNKELYSISQRDIIIKLIENKQWIIEESMDLLELVNINLSENSIDNGL